MGGHQTKRWLVVLVAAGLVGLGAWQAGGGGYILAKAWLAQVLLSRAWAATLAGAREARPWAWADTWPVARLQVPGLSIDHIVLAGAGGRTLAFGPGHLEGTALPGNEGHAVLGGHRDTHFAFIKHLRPGMVLRVQNSDGQWRRYRVAGNAVIDHREARLVPAAAGSALTLVTCYPFEDWQPGGPLRYLVFAEEVSVAPRGAPSP